MTIVHPWVAERTQTVRVGINIFDPCADWPRYRDFAQAVEKLGFDSLWVADHPTRIADSWITLSALTTATKHIRLGTLVSCVFFHQPALIARRAIDIDRLSNGRFVLGLGIGNSQLEFENLGVPFLSTPERQEALEETIHVIKGIWEAAPFTYKGKYVQIQQAKLPFGPIQQPYIPLIIAGGGERVTLRQVAQYADASNFGPHILSGSAFHISDVVRKCNCLQTHCETLGRPFSSILRTHLTLRVVLAETRAALDAKQNTVPAGIRDMTQTSTFAGTPDEAIAYCHALIKAGIQYFIFGLRPDDLDSLQLLSKYVLPALAHTNLSDKIA